MANTAGSGIDSAFEVPAVDEPMGEELFGEDWPYYELTPPPDADVQARTHTLSECLDDLFFQIMERQAVYAEGLERRIAELEAGGR